LDRCGIFEQVWAEVLLSEEVRGQPRDPILEKVLKACPCALKAIVTSANIPGRAVEGCIVSRPNVLFDIGSGQTFQSRAQEKGKLAICENAPLNKVFYWPLIVKFLSRNF
jgi:hypothetical protein